MEKLTDFRLLECAGRWHRSASDAGVDVVVKIDNSLLTLVGKDDRTIVAWTCDAIRRLKPGSGAGIPAFYSPDGEGEESVEIFDSTMISVLDDIISQLAGPEIKSGLSARGATAMLSATAVAVMLLFAFSGDIARQLAGLISARERQEIGERILVQFLEARGGSCEYGRGPEALRALERRLFPAGGHELIIVPDASVTSLTLPGAVIILGNGLLEAYDGPEAAAGFAVAESVASRREDPFAAFLQKSGLWVAAYLAMGKGVDDDSLREFAASVPVSGPVIIDEAELLSEFGQAGFSSLPFAELSGREGRLIDDDPFPLVHRPLLPDGDWLRLRDICFE